MDTGREFWIGKLDEPVAAYPLETHCLHMKSPIKDIIFLINEGDTQNLAMLFHAAFGPVDPIWLARMAEHAISRAEDKEVGDE